MVASQVFRKAAMWALLSVLVVGLGCPLPAQEPPPGLPSPGEEEPWDKEPPDAIVPGEETDEGATFETPFLVGISSMTAQFIDCVTGAVIAPDRIETEYYFVEGAVPPYEASELERVVVWASGYLPREITQFETFSVNLFFLTVTILYPAEGHVLCLTPSSGSVDPVLVDSETPPQLEQPGPPVPVPPAQCGAKESQREVWKVMYHPTSVIVTRGQNAKGGLETTFEMNFDREKFWKVRDRGPCALAAGHSEAHSPWEWSAWREDGSETAAVTFTKTIGGWPDGMSPTYFESWVIGSCYGDLAAMGLTLLRYQTGSFDPKAYYELFIEVQLEMG